MEKPIEFDANVRVGAKPDRHPVAWIPVPDDLYARIPTHLVDGQCESVERFHVTFSPVEDQGSVEEPDYKVQVAQICQDLKSLLSKVEMNYVRQGIISDIKEILQRNQLQSPGVKKEET